MSERIDELVFLVNKAPHVVPERLGEVLELQPAIVYAEEDCTFTLHLGERDALLTPFPHADIARDAAPVAGRRISAIDILCVEGDFLAVDGDRANIFGGVEAIRVSLGDEFEEIFIGGLSELSESSDEVKTLSTAGLIRQVSMYERLARVNGLNRKQTVLALGICISQLANGFPMPDQEVIAMVKSDDSL